MESKYWDYEFNYYDFEPGFWFLEEGIEQHVTHEARTPLNEIKFKEGSFIQLAVTRENLEKYMSYEKDDFKFLNLEEDENNVTEKPPMKSGTNADSLTPLK